MKIHVHVTMGTQYKDGLEYHKGKEIKLNRNINHNGNGIKHEHRSESKGRTENETQNTMENDKMHTGCPGIDFSHDSFNLINR